MSSTSNEFGSRLRKKREEMGLSQAAFAELMGVHRRSQINYETGKRQPTLEYLKALENAGVDLSQLMGMGEAVQALRASAYFTLLSKITALLGMRSERLGFALDQAFRITLDTVKMQGGEMVVDEEKLEKEMTKLAMKLLQEEGIKDFS